MTTPRQSNWIERNWPLLRDMTLFFGGLIGAGYETLSGEPNPELLLLFGAMMGLAPFLPRPGE